MTQRQSFMRAAGPSVQEVTCWLNTATLCCAQATIWHQGMYWDRCYDEFAILGRGREYTQPVGVRTQLHPEPVGQMIIVHVPRAPALQYASFC